MQLFTFNFGFRGRRGHDFMVARFALTLFVRIQLMRGILDTTLCDYVCQLFKAGLWFSPDTPVSSTSKTDRHNITEILLKLTLNTITLTLNVNQIQ